MPEEIMIDKNICTGCGVCVVLAPGVFAMDKNVRVAKVISQTGDTKLQIMECVEMCPVGAISVESD